MINNYNVMADYIVSKYIKRISGDDLDEIFVDENPAKRVMVGMLAENRMEESFSGGYIENNNTRFDSVPSISISFIVKKNDAAVLEVIPRGLFFYCVKPDYDKTVDYIISKFSEKDNYQYNSIVELCDRYPEEKFNLPSTYKRINIEDEISEGIKIYLNKIDKSFHLEDEINNKLSLLSDKIRNDICIVKASRITFFDLLNKEKFQIATGISDEVISPRWRIDIYVTTIEEEDSIRFLLQMVNKTPLNEKGNIGYLPQLFNSGIKIIGNNETEFIDIKLDCFKNSFKERPLVYAVTENTSSIFQKEQNTIMTDNIPKYYQKRLKTKDDYNKYVTFENLIVDPVGNLKKVLIEMENDYELRKKEFYSYEFPSETAKSKFIESLNEYKMEINRFKKGISHIEYKDFVKRSFIYMNQTFDYKLAGDRRLITGWRLFQIVFIVSLIGEMIRSEYPSDSSLIESDLETANLLYFPTGGGKTEAFLGACVFDMFFDRLRGKNDGITAFLKYPLRLLAVQQLDRVLTVVMKANKVRENILELKDTTPFSVGFFVGKSNTPNKISNDEKLSDRGYSDKPKELIIESDQETLNEYYRFIDTCPCCGKKMINVLFNTDKWTLEHVCNNPECSESVLPLFIVDNEIYRYLPSLIVSTIDKMAMLGTTNEFKMLFGQVKKKCPVHGFTAKSSCLCDNCNNKSSIPSVGQLKDPIPTLFIQDEMHLVKESLGTFDAHYESFIDYYCKELVPDTQRKQIRFIGATATISQYKQHIHHLYHMDARRFPCEYPSIKNGQDFYSYTDCNDITRILLGYAPYGRSITDGMWESVYIMRLVVYSMFKHSKECYEDICNYGFIGTIEDYVNVLHDYWIDLVYNNRKQDAIELENSFQNQANNYLEAMGYPKFEVEQMTSDVDFQSVRKTLFDIQANRNNLNSTNLILATSTISHGVDEDSFNVMYFFGMPNNNAEYIQAYSRTGRKYTGIVIDIIRLMRVRDRSYLKNFVVFHQNKDDLVESVPINRWAKNAIYSTLPGILSGVLMQYYTIQTNSDDFYQTNKVKRLLLNESIRVEDVIDKVIHAYGCNDNEKLSIFYKDIIREELTNILNGIKNGIFSNNDFLSKSIAKYSHGKKGPMRSLRDTEEQIVIKI